jgi:folate-binding protein YgfZ
MSILLGPAELLVLEGADAIAFAQAQFTSDVGALEPGHWQWSAWLDPLGRARSVFVLVHSASDRLIAWLPLGDARAFGEELKRFVFRSKLRLEALQGWGVHRLERAEAPAVANSLVTEHAGGFELALPGRLSPRLVRLAPTDATADAHELDLWRRGDIEAHLPLLPNALAGEFVPQSLDLDRLGAVRFDKGCYPGQEIAARLHFRGGNKRHLHRVQIDAGPVEPGARILDANGHLVGQILYSATGTGGSGYLALAVLTDASLAVAGSLSIEGKIVSICD